MELLPKEPIRELPDMMNQTTSHSPLPTHQDKSDIAIRVQNLSKCYQIYDQPRDRLKQFVVPKLCRAIPALRKLFPTPHSSFRSPYFLQRILGAQRCLFRNQKRRNRRHHWSQWIGEIYLATAHLRHAVVHGRERGNKWPYRTLAGT